MAPFRRGTSAVGNGRPRGSHTTGTRGSGTEGRRRGRSRGAFAFNRGHKSTFHSTRVEEPNLDGDEESQISSEDLDDVVRNDLSGASSEEDNIDVSTVKPYNALLQSLNANVQRGQPSRKKRKLTSSEATEAPHADISSHANIQDREDLQDVDLVEEPEDAGQLSSGNESVFADDNDDKDSHDPFDYHFTNVDEQALLSHIKQVRSSSWTISKSTPVTGWKAIEALTERDTAPTSSISTYRLQDLQLKQKLRPHAERYLPEMRGLVGSIASRIFSYQDLLFCDRTPPNASELRSLTCLHAINHIFKTRDNVIKNNARLTKSDAPEEIECRDQGFTRPKVLMLLPTRQSCVKAVDAIISLCQPEQQENRKRFQDSYARAEEHFSNDKPTDFRELFAGNDDDMFRIGMKFTRKTVKYFSQFYNSDIIFASPLGLKMAMGSEDPKKQDHDFLSSIEIVIVDQTDALLMQNWEHLEYIFEHLNLQPKETHGCDFSRVRNWYLDGNAKYLRQTVILSAFNTPEINRLYGHFLLNTAGKIKIGRDSYEGAMLDMGIQLKQTFSRYDAFQPADDPDSRFKFFTITIIPTLTKSSRSSSGRGQGVLIFIPSYMDFVRIRNFMANSSETQHISFGSISEYTSVRDVTRARSHFFSGRHSVLLYTGRAHHFRRYLIKGVKRVIMYALPDNPIFYREIVGEYLGSSMSEALMEVPHASVRSLFSKWDALKFERIVGTKRFVSMLREKGGDTFDFL